MVRRFSVPFPRGYSIRLHRTGCNNRPFYLIGAMPTKVPVGFKPDKRPDEVIGSIDPMPNEHNEHIIACDLNRLCYYLGKGANPSKLLSQYLGLAGFYPFHPKLLINSWRARKNLPTRKGLRPTVHPMTRADEEEWRKQQLKERKKEEEKIEATS